MGKVIKGVFPLEAKPIVSAESDVETLLERDQWGRPLILPPDHEPHAGCSGKKCGSAYRRASSVAEAIEDHIGLDKWRRRLTIQGLAQRPDLVQAVHTATSREVMEIAEQAFLQAGGDMASRNGSTMHALTDKLDRGLDMPQGLPSHIVAMLEAYEAKMSRFRYLDGERFVVQDKIKVAGSYDRRLYDEVTQDTLIGDLKTGQSLGHLTLKTPAQVAVYAAGKHYDLDGDREAHGANRDRGLLIHLPWTDKPEQATCDLYWLDLVTGRAAILEAQRIDRFRKIRAEQTMTRVKDA